ncbi:MAG: ArsA family ATPase [Oscillatoria sp. Prado101]|nr:ArsA family ATPase [Oscillatoria sp. Prado101]
MALILTFLGKGGTGRTTIAIAAAKRLASSGQRVLLASSDPGPGLGLMLGATLGPDPQEIAANLKAVQFHIAVLLERGWEELKKLEAQYVRTPFFKAVYGQELGVLPGMETALTMNAIREYDASGQYDAIVCDLSGDQNTLRMLGSPEILSWYIRRFRQVFADSDLGKTLSPFVQPVTSAVLNVDWSADNFAGPTRDFTGVLDKWRDAIANPNRVAAYLVTTGNPVAVATARYLWGSAGQVGVIVGGAILNQAILTDTAAAELAPNLQQLYATYEREASVEATVRSELAPLPVSPVPFRTGSDWQPLIDALPDFSKAGQAPRPISIDVAKRQVSLFLPGFDKKQVKLTQYGPEVTIEAGDQRRNILLPPELSGKPVKGAKFQNQYLIVSFS